MSDHTWPDWRNTTRIEARKAAKRLIRKLAAAKAEREEQGFFAFVRFMRWLTG